jgi:hypothetical protein
VSVKIYWHLQQQSNEWIFIVGIYERQIITIRDLNPNVGTMGKLPWAGSGHDFEYIYLIPY